MVDERMIDDGHITLSFYCQFKHRTCIKSAMKTNKETKKLLANKP